MTDASFSIGFLLFPRLTQLDLTGPFEVFSRLPGAKVHLAWKTMDPVRSDSGMAILPSVTFADCPPLDLLCVPGGPGQIALMDDEEVLAFLRRMATGARYVTSVCTGALVLGAAGLLEGYRAATHWTAMDQLEPLGAIPVAERVVFDRNRITGGGVTAGIDFALSVVAEVSGEAVARAIQLQIEYEPAPPFSGGSPTTAPPQILAVVRARAEKMMPARREATARAAARLAAERGSARVE
jgi:cyclohexyl-isocyanide hydratase